MFALFALRIPTTHNFRVISARTPTHIKGYASHLKNLKFSRGNYETKLDSFSSFTTLVSKLSDFQQNTNCHLNL